MLSLLYGSTVTYIYDYWKNHSFDHVDVCQLFLLFNTLSRFVITFLPRSKRLLISWLQSLSVVILEPKKTKCIIASTFPPSICHEVTGPNGTQSMILVFLNAEFQASFFIFQFHPHQEAL